jgi:HAD superfamily hydrolase (TIGR01509 family)
MAPDIDLVIFDCDGVLVDSEVIAVQIDQRVLAEFGWDLSIEDIVDRFLGKSSASFAAQVEEHLGRPLPAEWEASYDRWYVEAFEKELQPVAGIEDALDRIDTATCVASSGSHSKLRMTLGHTGLLPRFDGRIYSASEVRNGKPAPDLFLHAAARMGVQPDRCVVVEDSKYGVRAAREAGMRALGYAGGLTPADWLADEGATVFTDMAELPGLLDRHGQ